MGKANLPTVAEAIELLGYWRTPTDDKRRVQAANVLADAHLETVDRTSLRARIAALEAEVAQLRSGIHPPVNPMPGGFSLENFMPGLKPEDADAFCEALDAASPDLSDSREECPRCGSSYIVDGKCKSMDSECEEIFELRAALARKDAALGMAVEALDEVSDSYGSHYQGGGCSCVKCRRTRRHAALAACREAMGETP